MNEHEKTLKDYTAYKQLSVNTEKIKDLQNYVSAFMCLQTHPKNLTEKNLIDFINSIKAKYTTKTLNTIKTTLKNFVKWYFSDYSARFRNLDRICRAEASEASYKPEEMLSLKDFEKLIKAEESFFWKAYFSVLFFGSCRPSEVCKLKWQDFEYDKEGGAFFTIFSNKNKKSFLKFVPENVAFYVKQLENNGSEYIFYNPRTKKPIGKKGAYWEIRRLSQKVFGRKIDLYLMRHSIATINYNKDNVKDDIIARQMGHTKSMKAVYTHNNRDKLKEQAKSIYIKTEIAPEKKIELEDKIAEQQKTIEEMQNKINEIISFQMMEKGLNQMKVGKTASTNALG